MKGNLKKRVKQAFPFNLISAMQDDGLAEKNEFFPWFLPAAKRHGHAELWVEKNKKKRVMVVLGFGFLFLVFLYQIFLHF